MPATKTKQKAAPITVTVTLADFDTGEPFRVTRDGLAIDKFEPLTLADYQPRGGTPLRDAAAKFIAHLGEQQSAETVTIGVLLDRSGSMGGLEKSVVDGVNEFVGGMRGLEDIDPEVAGKVLAVIVTDGEENSSREVDAAALAKMIAAREAEDWTFIYLGTDHDAWAAGAGYGLSGNASGQTVAFTKSASGTASAMASVTNDAVGYLGDNANYLASARTRSKRSITEDGSEVLTNTSAGAQPTAANPTASAWTHPLAESYSNVGDALDKAKKATSKSKSKGKKR